MATYLNDLRLTELATGEGSGTWGTTTNTSLELIGEALGYATQQVFGSDADATTTIADGASDPARAMYFKITSAGSLTATRTCTIAPNTVSRVMFIENATTGSQSIAISQGSGASVTILAGKTAVVYLDGAGSGAAVVDAMAGVDPGVTDTLAEVLAAGNTSGANNLIIDNGQAITTNTINETTAASGVTIDSVLLKDDGVNATNLEITNLKANDGTSAGSIADSTGVVTLASSVLTTADINGGTIDGTTIGATTPATGAFTDLALSKTQPTLSFNNTGGNSYSIRTDTNNLIVRSVTAATDAFTVNFDGSLTGHVGFNGTLGATTPASVAATTLSTTGAATFSGLVAVSPASGTAAITFTSGGAGSEVFSINGQIPGVSNTGFAIRNVTDSRNDLTIDGTGAATFGGTLSSGGITTTGNTAAGTASAGDGRLFPNNAYGAFVYGNGTTYDVALGQRSTGVALGVPAGTTNVVIPTGNVGIGTAAPESIVHIKDSGNVSTTLQIEGAATGYAPVINFDGIVAGNADYLLGEINGSWDTHTNVVSAIRFESGADTTNKDDGLISFWTSSSGPTLEERMRIDASGNLGLGVVPTTNNISKSISLVNGGSIFGYGSGTYITANSNYNGAWNTVATGADSRMLLDGNVVFSRSTSATAGSAGTVSESMRIDSSGNVGIGVVPSAWAGVTGLQLSSGCSLNGSGVNAVLGANSYYDGTNWKYIVSAFSTNYYSNYANDGSHVWQIAPSGTAGDTITYTHAMTLDASGNLLVGASSTGEAHILQSSGASKLTLSVTNANATTPYGQKINFSAAAPNDATYYFLTCADTSAQRATIRSNGGLANYSANDANLSDEREKNQFGLLGSTTACLREWEIVKYLYKDEDQTLDPKYGVIAQQVAPHCPEVITDWVKVKGVDEVLWTDEDELPEGVAVGDVKTAAVQQVDRIGVKEQQMFWMLVKSHQEALDTIDALTARLDAAGL
jgi:fibronectin-binding autotransporter adhesin